MWTSIGIFASLFTLYFLLKGRSGNRKIRMCENNYDFVVNVVDGSGAIIYRHFFGLNTKYNGLSDYLVYIGENEIRHRFFIENLKTKQQEEVNKQSVISEYRFDDRITRLLESSNSKDQGCISSDAKCYDVLGGKWLIMETFEEWRCRNARSRKKMIDALCDGDDDYDAIDRRYFRDVFSSWFL